MTRPQSGTKINQLDNQVKTTPVFRLTKLYWWRRRSSTINPSQLQSSTMVDSIHKDYFVFDLPKYIFYTSAVLYVVVTCLIVSFQPLIYNPGSDCEYESARQKIDFHNPEYGTFKINKSSD